MITVHAEYNDVGCHSDVYKKIRLIFVPERGGGRQFEDFRRNETKFPLSPEISYLISYTVQTNMTEQPTAPPKQPKSNVNTWEPLASMSVARWNAASAVIDENRCLIVGGQDEKLNYMSSGEIYDCQTNQWTSLPNDMPSARVGSSAACIDNKIYVIGGRSDESVSAGTLTNSNVSSEMLVLDVNTMEWEQQAIPMKQSRFASAAVAVGRFIYVFGGVSGTNGSIVHAERFNVDSQKWDNLPPMSTKRYGCAAVAVGKKIYIIGGEDGTKSLETMEVFDIDSAQWESGSDMITPRWGCDAVSIGRFILVIGGEDGNTKNLSTAEVLDVNKPQWKRLPPTMSTPRYGHVAVVLAKSRIVVAGGHNSTEQILLPGLIPKQQAAPQPAIAAATATSMLQTPSKLSLPSMSMKAPKLGFFSS